jgi:DNA-directed RNA polymerase specialized sigma24 family protein
MANKNLQESADHRAEVLRLFRIGHSKAEVAKLLGVEKKAVERDLAIAIREAGRVRQ